MPIGADNNTILEQGAAAPRRVRTARKLRVAAGLVVALNWTAGLALVFRDLPSFDGLYLRLVPCFLVTYFWFISNSLTYELRGRKRAMTILVLTIVSGLCYAIGSLIELRWGHG